MTSKIDNIVKIYKALSQTQVLLGAKLLSNGIINSTWSQRNIEKGKSVKFCRMHTFDSKLNKINETLPYDISNEILHAITPSEKLRAVVREVSDGKDVKKQFLEIWNNSNLTNAVDLTALDIHGDVYTDGDLGSFQWSPDETKILYIAEKKLPKTEPFYKRKAESTPSDKSTAPLRGEEYAFHQSWGEQLATRIQSVIVVYDIKEDKVTILDGVPNNICPGQVIWSSCGDYLFGVAFETEPRKLGLVYCTNRKSTIFKLDFKGNYVDVTGTNKCVVSPKMTPDGKYLLWMEQRVGGPHRSAMALMRTNLPISDVAQPFTVIDVIQTHIQTTNGRPFYGLYNTSFPKRCFASDNTRIILSTNQKVEIKTYIVDIESCDITEIEIDEGSQIVLDVHKDMVLTVCRHYFSPDRLTMAILPEKGKENEIKWIDISENRRITGLENHVCRYLYLSQKDNNNDEIKDFSAIYYGPKAGKDKAYPLVVWPHGGPHSAFFNAFALEAALLALLDFAIVFVNFRGSLGAGQANVDFLPGRVGDTDVKDCVLATKECCKLFPFIDPDRLLLCGGSHGGFLIHHLSGQYPEMFKAVASRNPVVDIATMSLVSDIPDWCAVEAGSEYTQVGPVDDELFMSMRKKSPIQFADKIKAPTYFFLGSKDLRVPCSQGMELYYRLKANGVCVKLNLYDDNHSLGSVPNEMDHIINSALWFIEHTTKPDS